jgi:predicted RNA-binding protein with PIN domain
MTGVERVLVDGSNLAHALGRTQATPRPAAGIIGAMRAAFPSGVRVEVVFDGIGQAAIGRGGIGRAGTPARAAENLFVQHAGQRTADRVIDEAVAAQLAADGPAGTWGILVVTDDRELRDFVQSKGARVAGTAWLAGRLSRVAAGVGLPGRGGSGGASGAVPGAKSGTSIGHRRPPRPPRSDPRD